MGDEGRLGDEGEGRMVEFGLRDSPRKERVSRSGPDRNRGRMRMMIAWRLKI